MKSFFAIFRPLSTGGMKRQTRWSTDKDRVIAQGRSGGLPRECVMLTIHAEKKPKMVHYEPVPARRLLNALPPLHASV